ncbi:MAG: restriction endonuclease subunit S [Limnohabitans sp.]|nr:restriction endonuclease subunit S [Limnohabitans sp.]
MKSNYSELGKYIREVNERNSDLAITNLLGVSMEKTFIQSVANLNGVDMSVYKVLKNEQLACKLMSVGRDEKLPVDLYREQEPSIVSSAYYVFEPNDKEELLPEYLMMWLCRPENDRYIGFISGGDVRGGISWETFCSLPIKVPSISKQREIVKEYNAIQNRITLNQQLIQKLEETAQAIYKQWFVEGIDLENLPEGWKVGKLSDLIEIKYGKAYSHLEEGNIPLYGSGGLMSKVSKALYSKPSVLIPRKGTLTNIMFVNHPFWCVDTMFYSIFKNEENGYYAYFILKQLDFEALNQGSAVPSMTTAFLNDIDVIIPNPNILNDFTSALRKIIKHKENLENENQKLTELNGLLLSKLATIES